MFDCVPFPADPPQCATWNIYISLFFPLYVPRGTYIFLFFFLSMCHVKHIYCLGSVCVGSVHACPFMPNCPHWTPFHVVFCRRTVHTAHRFTSYLVAKPSTLHTVSRRISSPNRLSDHLPNVSRGTIPRIAHLPTCPFADLPNVSRGTSHRRQNTTFLLLATGMKNHLV